MGVPIECIRVIGWIMQACYMRYQTTKNTYKATMRRKNYFISPAMIGRILRRGFADQPDLDRRG